MSLVERGWVVKGSINDSRDHSELRVPVSATRLILVRLTQLLNIVDASAPPLIQFTTTLPH
jgi:hypothetical protein